mmetsp:Transcript_18424/g.43471  ORF Transcript_18424/g.43471 Transcript_18424/m.43471 type:complete len:217 (+) Transcript_18424:484-1134(+)
MVATKLLLAFSSHATLSRRILLRRTRVALSRISRKCVQSCWDIRRVQYRLADSKWALSVHALLFSGAGPSATCDVQQYCLFDYQCHVKLDLCLWRTLSILVGVGRTWLYWSGHLSFYFQDGARACVFSLYVCLQTTSQGHMAGRWSIFGTPHVGPYQGVYETVLAQFGNLTFLGYLGSSNNCFGRATGRTRHCGQLGLVHCHHAVEWNVIGHHLHH